MFGLVRKSRYVEVISELRDTVEVLEGLVDEVAILESELATFRGDALVSLNARAAELGV